MAATATQKPATTGNKPTVKVQLGNISVAVFTREVSTPSGQVFPAKDFVLQKSWKDKNGNWQDQSISFKQREILTVTQALTKAFVDSYDNSSDDEE